MSKATTKTSIALCTYNGEEYLSEQLDSLRRQSVLPDELVIGDDGSSDRTVSLIDKFATKVPFPVKLQVNEDRLGSSKNFEHTILRCTGDIIFLCDQDDIWVDVKIEKMLAAFDASENIGLVFTNAELVSERAESTGQKLWDSTFSGDLKQKLDSDSAFDVLLCEKNFITGATMAFSSNFKAVLAQNPVPKGLIHDHWLSVLASMVSRIVTIDAELLKYRQHAAQQIGVSKKGQNRAAVVSSRAERYTALIDVLSDQTAAVRELKNLGALLPNYSTFQLFFQMKEPHFIELIDRHLSELQDKIKHFAQRKNLPQQRLRRFHPVLTELRTGRYGKYSRGLKSAMLDVSERA